MADSPQNYCVVISRPEAQAAVWHEQLQALGFNCARLNLLEIAPVVDDDKIRAIKNKILDFDLYQKVIFVSQNAVEYGMDWLEDYWPQLPMGIDYFAVGATTAKKLASYGVAVQDLAASASGGMTSEDLLSAEHLQDVDGEKILIFRGCGGRGHLAEELRKRGAWVDYCELYERGLPAAAEEHLQQLIVSSESSGAQVILSLHSGESLQNLSSVLAQLPSAQQEQTRGWMLSKLLLVPSQRIVAAAQAAGFQRIICAENATDNAMTAALLNYCRTQECILLQD
ncbi:uroporphyrinogen-III synthase [Cellvibrio fibrivorans]|uniref:Uroporphyrinogen-III synthase n=1 Tax=Cellvibrio fibrivorans TaxID=126350 RepID=A0ABU1UTM1_9GAMM|nr:uroporphyrinogen-III synthase [Cellvibrio fibrivorans]MDR7088529.1 uroporphyrinogen-III synthase [Cellvibrio fibrivorans]